MRILDKDGKAGSVEDFEFVVKLNLVGSFNALRLGAERMAELDAVDGERGAIVMTASVAAFEGQIGQINYTASKAGIVGMTVTAARDLASRGIRVNTIAPGIMDTPPAGAPTRRRAHGPRSLCSQSLTTGSSGRVRPARRLDARERLPQRRDHQTRRRYPNGSPVTGTSVIANPQLRTTCNTRIPPWRTGAQHGGALR